MGLSKDLVAATAEPLVLSILGRGESYGYALIKEVQLLSGGRVTWTEGMLYPVLHRLEKNGCIRSEWKTSGTGRKRKYYAIETKGKARLSAQLEDWDTAHAMLAASRGAAAGGGDV
jgi:DNA-binding PadR family transcriptional regulator